ncbi:MAG: HAD family hydrolase [Clostridia bacterium]|nr:HAD family hydrolase [Clostridia bacterium]
MKYDLAIFDLDGTILDTLDDLHICLNRVLDRFSYPHRTRGEVRSFMGNGIRRLIELGVPAGTSSGRTDEVFALYNDEYAAHCDDNTHPYDGVCEMLDGLKRDGVRIAVVSNKADYAVQPLMRRHFAGKYDFAVGLRDGIRKKPYPDSVNAVLTEFGADRRDAVYIGDTEVDRETAKNAGIDCISVDWGFRDRAFLQTLLAEYLVSSPAEVYDIIAGKP